MHSSRALPVLLGMLALMGATTAGAQVIEIDSDGAATVYDAPAIYTSEGVRAIAPAKPAATATLTDIFADTAGRHALDPHLLEAVAWTKSRLHQSAVSPKGAVGVMQLMDGTARQLGVNRFDMHENIEGGAAYLDQLLARYHGDLHLALAAYNAGPGAVDRHGGIPPYAETQTYVRTVLNRMGNPMIQAVNQIEYPPVILIAP